MSYEKTVVHQLVVGFAREENGYRATGSVTLIRDGPLRVLVDCGDPWNGGVIINTLMEKEVTCSDITHLVITHGHVDHCGNMSLFKNAQVFMAYDYVGPDGIYSAINKEKEFKISENIKIKAMKGHTAVDLIVKVENCHHGVVIVAGDLFECENDEDSWRQLSEYPEEQAKNRQWIREEADVIIPGHGPLFFIDK